MQRRRLGAIVVGALAACGLILVAAVIARVSQASNGPARSPNAARSALATMGESPTTSWEQVRSTHSPGASSAVAALAQMIGAPLSSDSPTTGTMRLGRAGAAGHVWLDGKKLTSTSALVACGVHHVRVGARGRARSVDVPCGGEIVVSK